MSFLGGQEVGRSGVPAGKERVKESGGSWIRQGGAFSSKDVSPRGAAEAGGGCENDLSEQTIVGPRRSHFKGIDH